MFLDSEKQAQPRLIEHLATVGLKYFHTLVEADNRQRRSMINRYYSWQFNSLEDALKHRPWPKTDFFQEEWEGWERSQKLEFEADEHQKRNLG